jgi:hypothetical protein
MKACTAATRLRVKRTILRRDLRNAEEAESS